MKNELESQKEAIEKIRKIFEESIKNENPILISMIRDIAKGREVLHGRFNCEERDDSILMIADLVHMVVSGTDTKLSHVLELISLEVSKRLFQDIGRN